MNENPIEVTANPGTHELVLTRVFDAPRNLVFGAYVDPEQIPLWWGAGATVVDVMDARPGGSWRYVEKDADGSEFGFRGVYHDVVAPERIVYTFEFEGMPGKVLLETVRFEEVDGGTRVIDHSVFQSVEDRDGMVATGAASGAEIMWNRLEALLAKGRG